MLPHVDSQQRRLAIAHGVLRIERLADGQLAVAALHQPGPAAAKLRRAGRLELLLQLVHAAEGLLDRCLQLRRGLGCVHADAKPYFNCALPFSRAPLVIVRFKHKSMQIFEDTLHEVLQMGVNGQGGWL